MSNEITQTNIPLPRRVRLVTSALDKPVSYDHFPLLTRACAHPILRPLTIAEDRHAAPIGVQAVDIGLA